MPPDIFSLLNQRGHRVTKLGSERDIFLPTRQDLEPELKDSFKVMLYNLMRNDSFRRSLRDWAYGNISENNSNLAYIMSYVKLCEKFGGWSNAAPEIRRRYASTFEWYVSELLCREFAARASGFGLRLKDADPDDEFDCVALLDNGLVFVECKTGREGIYAQIKKFLRRDTELLATYSFFVFDRADDTIQNVNGTVTDLRAPMRKDLTELQTTLEEAKGLLQSMQIIVRANDYKIDDTVENLREATDNLNQFTNSLKQRPWSLIRAEQPGDRRVQK